LQIVKSIPSLTVTVVALRLPESRRRIMHEEIDKEIANLITSLAFTTLPSHLLVGKCIYASSQYI